MNLHDGSADVSIGPSPSELSHQTAFRIFPIAHQYNMQTIMMWCDKAVGNTKLELCPPQPIATSSNAQSLPVFVQWLALADEKQSDTLVESCLSQLNSPEGIPTIKEALSTPHLHSLMASLRPETMIKIMRRLVACFNVRPCLPPRSNHPFCLSVPSIGYMDDWA